MHVMANFKLGHSFFKFLRTQEGTAHSRVLFSDSLLGRLAKNDVIDAQVIRLFADAVNPKLLPTASETQQALDAQVHRREQLVKQRAMEKQHLESVGNKDAVRSIKRTIAFLDKEIKRIEKALKALINADSTLTE